MLVRGRVASGAQARGACCREAARGLRISHRISNGSNVIVATHWILGATVPRRGTWMHQTAEQNGSEAGRLSDGTSAAGGCAHVVEPWALLNEDAERLPHGGL